MSFARQDMRQAKVNLRRLPIQLRLTLEKAADKVGPFGVKVARTLVAVDTGETARSISYETDVKRDANGGWYYQLRIFIDSRDRLAVIKAFVTEFGRGQGRGGARARGRLVARPYLRPSRELTAKKAKGAFMKAMRDAAKVIATRG